MDKLLEDYKSYYLTRSKRYANNPNFKRSALAEKNLSDAMQSCNALEEAKDKIGDLSQLCASAFLLDKSDYYNTVFTELKETVRAKGNAEIVEKCKGMNDVNELIRVASEIMLENNKDISLDLGTISFFKGNLSTLENIEEYENAEVPSSYQAETKRIADRSKAELKKSLLESQDEFRKYHPTFTFEWEILWEHRHRKLIPIPDEVLKKRIHQIKTILN